MQLLRGFPGGEGRRTTAGPLAEITWSIIPFWLLRVDVSTQFIAIPYRVTTWSYPLWVGFSVPAFW